MNVLHIGIQTWQTQKKVQTNAAGMPGMLECLECWNAGMPECWNAWNAKCSECQNAMECRNAWLAGPAGM